MKILQLVTKRQYRGAEVASATFSEAFIRQGHEVIFTGLYKAPAKSLQVKGAVNTDVDARKSFFSIQGFFRLLKLVRKEKPDILHANGSDTLKYLVAVKLFRPGSVVVYRNISVISHWRGSNPIKNAFYNFLFRRVNFVTSVGETSRKDFSITFPFTSDKISVVKRGIRIEDRISLSPEQRSTLDIPVNKTILIHVGNFSPEKNHHFLIDSFAKLVEAKLPVVLLLAGEGSLKSEVQNKVKSLGLENEVIFLGLQEDITPFVASAELILLTSKVEGVPGVLLEAAAQYVPAVALNVGGVSESVLHGETGVLVNQNDADQFSEHVKALLQNAAERKRLGENAARFVKENHDLEQNARKFLSIFEGLLNTK